MVFLLLYMDAQPRKLCVSPYESTSAGDGNKKYYFLDGLSSPYKNYYFLDDSPEVTISCTI